MGMGKTGIPSVPWDSRGNVSKISHENSMGMGIKCMGMGVKTWELSPATVNSLLSLHGVRAVMRVVLQPETEQVVLN